MNKNTWIGIVIIGVVAILIAYFAGQSSAFTVYPVQCNDWFMATAPYTPTPPTVQDFSNCHKPEAMERQSFSVDISKGQVTETSPDDSEVVQLNSCTIQDGQHWSCGDFSKWSGGILGATQTSRSADNFNEYGLTGVTFVTESQWDSINNGKDSICGTTWCDSSNSTTTAQQTSSDTSASTQTNNQTITVPQTSDTSSSTTQQFPTEKCVTESGVKICDLSHSVQQTFGDGTRNVSFQANAIDCVDVATGGQTQNQGDVALVDSGNTYCASDIGAVYIDPTILVAKYFNTITQNNNGSYQVPATYGTCIWTYAGGSGDIPYVEVSGSVGPLSSYYNVNAFCQNGTNQVDIYSYKAS